MHRIPDNLTHEEPPSRTAGVRDQRPGSLPHRRASVVVIGVTGMLMRLARSYRRQSVESALAWTHGGAHPGRHGCGDQLRNRIDRSRPGCHRRQGADVVITANSSVETHAQALKMARSRGRINYYKRSPGLTPTIDGPPDHYRLSLTGSHGSVQRQHRLALELISAGVIVARDYITHRFPLDQIAQAAASEGRAGMKVIVEPQKAEPEVPQIRHVPRCRRPAQRDLRHGSRRHRCLHIDVMDGSLCPTGTQLRPARGRPGNAFRWMCLMIERPERYIRPFMSSAPRCSSSGQHPPAAHLAAIRGLGMRAGVVTRYPLETLRYVLDDIDLLLIMTVNPGCRAKIPSTLGKIADARALFERIIAGRYSVDGNVSFENAVRMAQAGANWLVGGTSACLCGVNHRRGGTSCVPPARITIFTERLCNASGSFKVKGCIEVQAPPRQRLARNAPGPPSGWHNYSLFMREDGLFGYVETRILRQQGWHGQREVNALAG